MLYLFILKTLNYIYNFLHEDILFLSGPQWSAKLLCNNYINPLSYTFENPKTSAMMGIIELYDYIMLYLGIVFIVVCVFLWFSVNSGFFAQKEHFKEFSQSKQLEWRSLVSIYIREKFYLKFSHNSVLEFIWTIAPGLVLVCIAYPSFMLLYAIDACIDPMYTVTIIGNQWYWSYEYSDFDVETYLYRSITLSKEHARVDESLKLLFDFFGENYSKWKLQKYIWKRSEIDAKVVISCNLLPENMLPEGYFRLLSTDQVLVLPSKTPVKLLITASDVIHSWAVPSYGIKMDAVPGRLNQVYFYTEFYGSAWGQCSELCGVNHGFMPIEVRVVPLPEFLYFVYLKLNSLTREVFIDILRVKLRTEILLVKDILQLIQNNQNLNNDEIKNLITFTNMYKTKFKNN